MWALFLNMCIIHEIDHEYSTHAIYWILYNFVHMIIKHKTILHIYLFKVQSFRVLDVKKKKTH